MAIVLGNLILVRLFLYRVVILLCWFVALSFFEAVFQHTLFTFFFRWQCCCCCLSCYFFPFFFFFFDHVFQPDGETDANDKRSTSDGVPDTVGILLLCPVLIFSLVGLGRVGSDRGDPTRPARFDTLAKPDPTRPDQTRLDQTRPVRYLTPLPLPLFFRFVFCYLMYCLFSLFFGIRLPTTGGVLLMVTGSITIADLEPRQFCQTFFLSRQHQDNDRHNYFVRNAIFRFLDVLPEVVEVTTH